VCATGGDVAGDAVRPGTADAPVPESLGVAAGAVATGLFTVGLALPVDEARLAKSRESAATSATPTPANHLVAAEMRRIPLSRSTVRRGPIRPSLVSADGCRMMSTVGTVG
jgi:hypothetical protein